MKALQDFALFLGNLGYDLFPIRQNNQTARGHPTLNVHVPQDNGTYQANEKQDQSTS